jgi:hypothetical protein
MKPVHAGVPFALDAAQQIADPQRVLPGKAYTCLACQEPVFLRRGPKYRAHFAHHAGSSCTATGESVEHRAFKRLLSVRLNAFRMFDVRLVCPVCQAKSHTRSRLSSAHEVAQEVRVGSYRADVAILGAAGEVRVAFEAYYAHRIPEEKALGLNVLWFEVQVNMAQLLKQVGGPVLTVMNTNRFAQQPCVACGNAAASEAQAHANVAAAEQQRLEEQQGKAAAARAAEQQARETLRAEHRHREQAELRVYQEAAPTHAREQAVLTAFLVAHLPDLDTRLSNYTAVVASCPGCRVETVFFDSRQMVPTWTALVRRRDPYQPWQSVCVHCDWQGRTPSGVAFTRSASAGESPALPPNFSVLPRSPVPRPSPPVGSFWWQDED